MPSKKPNNSFALCVFPGYRWCGPGCSGPGAPINDVDACCWRHDRCLRLRMPACECDRKFIDCLRPKINPKTDKGKKAALMYSLMRMKTAFFCK
nr:phospholipase [Peribacillus deserti]